MQNIFRLEDIAKEDCCCLLNKSFNPCSEKNNRKIKLGTLSIGKKIKFGTTFVINKHL